MLYYDDKHEFLAHAINESFSDPPFGETVGYSPSIFNSDHIEPNAKDIAYRKLGYTLKFLRQTDKQYFNMTDLDDAITTITNHAPSQSTNISPANSDATIDARAATTFTWNGSTDADGDWVRYNIHLTSSDAKLDTIIKNINSTMLTLPAGTLKDNVTYIWNITATDNDLETQSSNSTFTTITHTQPNNPPTPFTVIQPINGDTATYVGGKIVFKYTRSTDADNDTIDYIINLKGPGIDTTFSTIDTTFSIDAKRFQKSSNYTGTVKATDKKDTTNATNQFDLNTTATSVKINGTNVPKGWMLYQKYPNPCNPTTTISYNLVKVPNLDKVNISVSLRVYDVLGREVAVLVNEEKPAGAYNVRFEASSLPSGIYFYRLISGTYTSTRKMLLLK